MVRAAPFVTHGIQRNMHRVSRNVPHLTCYNLDEHNPITIIFGTNVTENVDKKASIR